MAKSDTKKTTASKRPEDPGRRDFIVIATNAMAGLGAAAVAWPLSRSIVAYKDINASRSCEIFHSDLKFF